MWAKEGRVPIRPKSQERGLMVSDFVMEHDGLLQLTDEEFEKAQQSNPSISKCTREIIKFGAASEGYWNSECFLRQMERAIAIAREKYPRN